MPDPSKAIATADISDRPRAPGFMDRARAGLRYVLTGEIKDEWFGPLRPLPSVVSPEQTPSVEGRQFDYQIGENLRWIPRSNEAVSFLTMRQLAEDDLLAVIIQSRKDQLSKLQWNIQPKDPSKRKALASKADEVEQWWKKPDKRHTFREWLTMLLDDLLVIDAPCVFVNRARGNGEILGFQPIDGATIKPVIDAQGHRPIPPDWAYSQALHGTPAVLYTLDQMIYKPRVLRTSRLYGYSPVERIIMTVNIAFRRRLQQLDHFTEGSIPNSMIPLPKEWSPEQIEKFAQLWNAKLAGNLAERSRAHFIPGGGGVPYEFKKVDLKDDFDEWLARVSCAAYGIDPSPFIKQVNRGTQETTREAALAEGLAPYETWTEDFIDECLAYQGYGDLQFKWREDDAIDPVENSTVIKTKIASGTLHPNEARAEDGLDPLDDSTIAWIFAMQHSPTPVPSPETWVDGQPPPALMPPSPAAASPSASGGAAAPASKKDEHASGTAAAGKGAAALQLGKSKALPRIDRERRVVKTASERLSRALTKTLRKMAPDVAAQIAKRLPSTAKASGDRLPEDIAAALDLAAMDGMASAFETELATVAKDGARLGADQVGIEVDVDLTNADALAWARDRGAELVGKKLDDEGNLVENPRAMYAITDGTREHLRGLIAEAIDQGWSTDTLASNVKASYAFSAARSEVIARTETARADVAGNLIGWKASDVVTRKEWIVGDDCCPECCDLDGVTVDLDEDFPGEGGDGPPLHPNCRCDVSPVIEETETA